MKHRRKPVDWKHRAFLLNKYGYAFPEKKPSDKAKSRIRRAWRKNAAFVQGVSKRGDVKFVKGAPVRGLVSTKARTPTGFFVQVPKGLKKSDFKTTVEKDGSLHHYVKGKNEIVVSLDPKALARDPEAEARRAVGKRRPVKISFIVNGWQGKKSFAPGEFFIYCAADLFDEWQHRNKSWNDFAKVFQLKLSYPAKNLSHAGKRKSSSGKTLRHRRH